MAEYNIIIGESTVIESLRRFVKAVIVDPKKQCFFLILLLLLLFYCFLLFLNLKLSKTLKK